MESVAMRRNLIMDHLLRRILNAVVDLELLLPIKVPRSDCFCCGPPTMGALMLSVGFIILSEFFLQLIESKFPATAIVDEHLLQKCILIVVRVSSCKRRIANLCIGFV